MSGRYFLAIDLNSQAKTAISAVVKSLRAQYSGAKWVREENYHLTLLFLGEQEGNALQDISLLTGELTSRQRPFTLVLNGLGFFPNSARARVMYIGAGQGSGKVTDLAHQLHALAGIPEKGFHPHLTLARFRQPSQVKEHGDIEPISAPVRELTLFSSTLTPAGPIYRVLRRFSFSGLVRGE